MKQTLKRLSCVPAALICLAASSFMTSAQQTVQRAGGPVNLVSYVDTDLTRSQKYVLKVDGKPFYPCNIQIRLEKLRYQWKFDAAARDLVLAQAAADGFNTVSLPIHWSEVEPVKDKFNWAILDEYLGIAQKHGLKMEMLWFGHNSGGMVQWLSPELLRVPAYVLSSPARNSPGTKSDYRIRRDLSPYTLDLSDRRLRDRETYVLSKVMAHIGWWDKAHGNKHTVIGVQLNNEVAGYDFDGASFTAGQVISYMSGLGMAVKRSPYVVWTRLNCIWGMEEGRIDVNEALRSTTGTGIDFVGVDLYRMSPDVVRSVLPYKDANYRMIMECEAEVDNAAGLMLTALSGNTAYDYYDMLGPDGHGLYDRDGAAGFKPHGTYVDEVRTLNRLLKSDIADIARNAQGYGLFVHNWDGKSADASEGVAGVVFKPASASSQAVSITRSYDEIVLMNTKGGSFSFPDSLKITGGSYGYFDTNDKWVQTGTLAFTSSSVNPAPGTTVRLTSARPRPGAVTRLQAESGSYGLASVVGWQHIGFAGNGYVDFNDIGGYVRWSNVDGGKGGDRTVMVRYANGGQKTLTQRLLVNNTPMTIRFPVTGSWEKFRTVAVKIPLQAGTANRISVEWTEQGKGLIDELQVVALP